MTATTPCKAEPGSRPLRLPHACLRFDLAGSATHTGKILNAFPRYQSPNSEAARRDWFAGQPASLSTRLKGLAPDQELGAFLEDLAQAVRAESSLCHSDSEAFAAGLPLEPKAASSAPQPHVQDLVRDFHRRQRRASMLVAGCIAASVVLTVAGIATLASLTEQKSTDAEAASKNSTSVAWRSSQADVAPARLILASASPDRTGKGVPLLIPARAAAADAALPPRAAPLASSNAAPKLILMKAGRPLALAPLLSQHQARYFLFRGLPSEAKLSAGQRNPSGAWLVKDEDLGELTLSIGGAASGDHPVEVYALGASSSPQARQRLIFRVGVGVAPTASADMSWPPKLLDMALMSLDPYQAAEFSDPSLLLGRAKRLLGEGDIAGARMLFEHLADRGQAEAAYELARTFDPQVLAELGTRGVGADRTRAVNWYERASETGSTKAAERLKTLASLSD